MSDTIKMPGGGYDVKVVRKEDIVKCIDDNIVDKDIMLEFISQLEVDATNFLSEGRWTSLPYIGTIRKNKYKEIINSKEYKELDETAKENLDKNKYLVFKKDVRRDIAIHLKYERLYRYNTSIIAKKNRKFFNYLVERKGDAVARLICYSLLYDVDIYGEQQTYYR